MRRADGLLRQIRRLEGQSNDLPYIAYCLTPRQLAAAQEEAKQHRRNYVMSLAELIPDEVWDHYAPYRSGEVTEPPDPWPGYDYPLP